MRTRRAAGVALFAFFVAMACFGMLSRAIDDASVARVSVVRAAPQALAGAAGEMPDEPEAQTVCPLCVPLGAVQADGPQRYVFVIEERAGFLGRETAVSSQQSVVSASTRPLVDGDRVRVLDA